MAKTDEQKLAVIKEKIANLVGQYWITWSKPINQNVLMKSYYPTLSRLNSSADEVLEDLKSNDKILIELSPKTATKYVFPHFVLADIGKDKILQTVMLET